MSIAFVVAGSQNAAVPYYRQHPVEPIPKASGENITIESPALMKDAQLATLFAGILQKVKSGGDVLVVSHGTENAVAIRIGLANSLGVDTMRRIVSYIDGRTLDEDMPAYLYRQRDGAAQWKQLKDLLAKVHALSLNRVDLRACEVGKEPDTMYYLQRLFNCSILCAPKAFDVFGTIDVGRFTSDARTWKKWREDHPGSLAYGFGSSGQFAIAYEISQSQVKVDAIADKEDAVREWVRRNLPPQADSRGAVYYHALTPDKAKLIFAGHSEYRDWLVEAKKGAPAPKVDLNAPIR